MLKQSTRTSKHANDQQGWQHDSSGLYFSLIWFLSLCIDQGSANSPGFQDDPPLLRTSKSDLHSPPSLERARSHPDHRQHRSPHVLKPCLRF